jgi:hypothetical protein
MFQPPENPKFGPNFAKLVNPARDAPAPERWPDMSWPLQPRPPGRQQVAGACAGPARAAHNEITPTISPKDYHICGFSAGALQLAGLADASAILG